MLDGVKKLVELGANIHFKFKGQYTPLYIAAQKGHLEVVKFFIKCGLDVDAPCSKGSTALYVAAQNGHFDVVKALVRAYANPDCEYRTESKARRPVDIAKESGFKEIERYLKQSLPYAGEFEPTDDL